MINPFKVKIVLCGNGERLPLLTSGATSLPNRIANAWLILSRRTNNQASTLEREARTIGYFHWWASEHGIDLEKRFRSGNGVSAEEINPSLYDWLRKDFTTTNKIKKMAVASITHRTRLETVRNYILWHLDNSLSKIDVANPLFDRITAKRDLIERQLNKDMPSVRMNRRIGLDASLRQKFLDIIPPDSVGNPWKESIRIRNHTLCLMLIMLGLRRAEALKIYLSDLNLNGARPTLTIKRRPDDINDPRKQEPRVKTFGRIIPLTPVITAMIHEYIINYRNKIPNAKKTPFLFLSSQTGKPLSQISVNNILYQLIKCHSEFEGILTPHILRHTYNDMLSETTDAHNISEHDATEIRNYLCGWSRLSQQGQDYRQRYIQQKSMELSLAHQMQMLNGLDPTGN